MSFRTTGGQDLIKSNVLLSEAFPLVFAKLITAGSVSVFVYSYKIGTTLSSTLPQEKKTSFYSISLYFYEAHVLINNCGKKM